MGWFKITDRNAYSTFFSFGSGGGDGHVIQTNTTGTAIVVWDGLSEVSTGLSVTDGVWAHIAFVCGSSTITPYLNGVAGTGFAGSGASIGTRTSILVGESHGGGEWLNAAAAALKFYDAGLSAADIQQEMRQTLLNRTLNNNGFYPLNNLTDDEIDYSGLARNLTPAGTLSVEDGPPIPWKTGRHRRIFVAAAAGGAFTLTADAGSYSVTGTAASLEYGRLLDVAAGSYAISGTDASLERGYEVAADAGAYTVSGTAATFRVTHVLAAEAGSVAVSGTAASLEYGRLLTASAGAYTVTGTDAALIYEQAGQFTLAADAGAFVVTGTAAGLRATRTVTADAGAFAVTGTAASLERGLKVTADAGAYTLTGAPVGLQATRRLALDPGVYVVTGVAAELTWSGEEIVVSQIAIRGSYKPSIALTGSYTPDISMTGSVH